MPLYEYKCASCGDVFEVIQKFSDEPLHVHEGCGGQVERLISTSAFNFKGSGWYVTDYGKNGSVKEGRDKHKPKSESSDSSKSEGSKPETSTSKETASTPKATKTE